MVEELTIRNLNSGKLEIVGASNPVVRDDSNSLSFSEFLDKKQEDRDKNKTTDNSLLEEKQLSPGGIRTKILSKSGFFEFFVKNTLKGKGVVFRGPAQDGAGVHIRGQSDSRDIPIPEPRPSVSPHSGGISLREWLNGGGNKVDKSRNLYIFKQILNFVDSSHSQGVALQALRPSCFRLLPSNNVLYLGSPAQKEVPEIHHLDNRDGKKRKYGENWKSFGRWPQFPNRSGSVHGTSHNVKPHIGAPRASGHGFNEENVVSGGNLLEDQRYASPEEPRERSSTLSSNIYALGVLLFELLGSFESPREHAVAMLHLRQRILPPSFLSENPKEAGYCLWLLHPKAPARPTTRLYALRILFWEISELIPANFTTCVDAARQFAESRVAHADRSVRALDLMSESITYLTQWALEAREAMGELEAAKTCQDIGEMWFRLVQGLRKVCLDQIEDVRNHALLSLQMCLTEVNQVNIQPGLWLQCFDMVIFTVLDDLLEISQGHSQKDFRNMEGTLVLALKLLAKVFLQLLPELSQVTTFCKLWLGVLSRMEKYLKVKIRGKKNKKLQELVTELLKNTLLVMKNKGVLVQRSALGGDSLWELTWLHVNNIDPSIQSQVFLDQDSEQKQPVFGENESGRQEAS